jgi:hypothetical protein
MKKKRVLPEMKVKKNEERKRKNKNLSQRRIGIFGVDGQ